MKHAKEYLKDILFELRAISKEEYEFLHFDEKKTGCVPEYAAFIKVIKQAQKDAYNLAIDDAEKVIDDHEEEVFIGVLNDILKLKK